MRDLPGPRDKLGAAAHAALQDPGAGVPSGTSVRFAVQALVVTASTASFFGYLWQLSRPGLEARTRSCLAQLSTGPLARLIAHASRGSGSQAAASAVCVRSAGPPLLTWSLTGIGILAALSLALYLLTPWWTIKVSWPGNPPLQKLDLSRDPELQGYLMEQAGRAGVPCPEFYVDWPGQRFADARTFGYRRRPYVRLPGGLVLALTAEAAGRGRPAPGGRTATEILLHELAHVRNRDNLPTYLTLAAWRAFVVLTPAAYLVMLAISGARPASPGPRVLVTVVILAALVLLSTRAVMRSQELHADATAAFLQRPAAGQGWPAQPVPGPGRPEPMLPAPVPSPPTPAAVLPAAVLPAAVLPAAVLPAPKPLTEEPPALSAPRPRPAWRLIWSYHPDPAGRAATLSRPQLLYRPDPLAMASAGLAIAIFAGQVTPALFSALLGSLLSAGAPLLSGAGADPLLLILLVSGPAALVTAVLVVPLACATSRRLEYLASVTGAATSAGPRAGLALPMAAGMLAGIPLGFDYVIAGAWGIFDTTAARNLIVAALSAAVLTVPLLGLFAWSGECTAVWFGTRPGRPRLVYGAMLVTGVLGVAPALLAWGVTSGLPLVAQLQAAVDRGQRPYIGAWPAATAVETHLAALGAFDIVPGGALLLALPCLLAAARSLRPPPQRAAGRADGSPPARVPAATVLVAGLGAAAVAVAAGLALMLWLHADIGGAQARRAGGFGLLYLNRATQAVIAGCAGLAAVWVARRADRTALTSGVLTALVTATAAAVLAPKLIVLGELGWGSQDVNPGAYATLYGIAVNMTPGKAVAAALGLMAAAAAMSRLTRRVRRADSRAAVPPARRPAHGAARPARPGSGARPSAAGRLAGALGFAAMLAALAVAAYFFLNRGLR
jgi:hypothetical protein